MGYVENQCGVLLFVLNLPRVLVVRECNHCFSSLHTHLDTQKCSSRSHEMRTFTNAFEGT